MLVKRLKKNTSFDFLLLTRSIACMGIDLIVNLVHSRVLLFLRYTTPAC